MKQVKAIVQPFMKEKVLAALWRHEGLPGIMVSEVIGCGKRHTGEPDEPVGAGHVFVNKAKLENIIPDELLEVVIDTVTQVARTGQFGDGKLVVSDVRNAIKIRTGERGSDAI